MTSRTSTSRIAAAEHGAAHQQRLVVRGRGLSGGRGAPRPDSCAWLVVLVEEGQEVFSWVAARSSRSRLTCSEDMRPGGVFLPVHPAMQQGGCASRAWKEARVTATEELPAIADPGLAMGRYRLGARLGAGGFGTVYAARDERLGRPVAVKVVPADGVAPERAQREARAVARLDHEGIVALFDAGEQDGCRYLVSELVEGRTLAQLEAEGALSDRDVVRIGLALTDALAHAHDRGVVHRDVKPQNVIVPDEPGIAPRRGEADRLRRRPPHRRGRADAYRRRRRDARLHGPRAGRRPGGGRARRRVRARRRALRGVRRRASRPRRHADRDGAADRHAARAARPPSRRPAGRALRGDRSRRPARAGASAGSWTISSTRWPPRCPASPTRAG